MDPSRSDRLLEDWDMVTQHAERPPEPPRPTPGRRLAAPLLAAALVVVLSVAALAVWTGRPDQGLVGGSPTPSPSATPSPAPTQVLPFSPSPAPSASVVPSPSDTLGPFRCDAPFTIAGTASGPDQAMPTDVRVGTHDGYDRITFEYAGATTPTITIEPVEPPFVHDPSGLAMTVAGDTFVRIRLEGVAVGYAGATELSPGFRRLAALSEQGDFEAVQSWIAGLTGQGPACVRVLVMSGPTRIVVDVQH